MIADDDGRPNGFIVLHRRIETSPAWLALRNNDQRMVFVQLLLMANWKPRVATYHGHEFEIGRGELIQNEETIAKRAHVGRQSVRSCLTSLELSKVVTRKRAVDPAVDPTARITKITILNYSKYHDLQELDNRDDNRDANRHPTVTQPRPNRDPTLLEEREQEKQREQEQTTLSKPGGSDGGVQKSDDGAGALRKAAGEIFAYWAEKHHPGARADEKRLRLIVARMKEGFSALQLTDAIDGCKCSAYHQGANENQRKYDSIQLIFRDAGHVEQFIQLKNGPIIQSKGYARPENKNERFGVIEDW